MRTLRTAARAATAGAAVAATMTVLAGAAHAGPWDWWQIPAGGGAAGSPNTVQQIDGGAYVWHGRLAYIEGAKVYLQSLDSTNGAFIRLKFHDRKQYDDSYQAGPGKSLTTTVAMQVKSFALCDYSNKTCSEWYRL